ncbi:unnamed protein product [Protopolystoma xenopodis]|uniref:Uncharacterized protein n=1 Tax=Protopolystoma xenopodis TaxID=117903 RepID=A0A448XK85_9PLAT|nr:unnamed protein product [Protopolystoma xenopodis]
MHAVEGTPTARPRFYSSKLPAPGHIASYPKYTYEENDAISDFTRPEGPFTHETMQDLSYLRVPGRVSALSSLESRQISIIPCSEANPPGQEIPSSRKHHPLSRTESCPSSQTVDIRRIQGLRHFFSPAASAGTNVGLRVSALESLTEENSATATLTAAGMATNALIAGLLIDGKAEEAGIAAIIQKGHRNSSRMVERNDIHSGASSSRSSRSGGSSRDKKKV